MILSFIYFSQTVPLLWAVLTLLCQIVSVLQPFFPYDLQVTAANYICTDLNALTREMEYTWHSLEFNDKPDEIKDLIHKIWDDDAYATEIGAAAMNRAYKTHDADTNMRRLLEIYNEIR